ncbi:MAG: aromatic ring-hydroxylating dioxygenase subunit alpha [Hyphomonadaceae bacterium]|nr:aromatic ring-hydroxylating dioxygenase subunit alpha [Hyphomonadaceae bacterium]
MTTLIDRPAALDPEAATRAHRRQYLRRAIAHLKNKTSDLADAPMANPVSVYTDPARHALERKKLFRETPLLVCLSTDLAEPGAFRVFDETGVPILVTRAKDGRVRAFLNVCRHRGAALTHEREGKASRFTCWFHCWTYSNEGKLIGAPQGEAFDGEMKGRDHLIEYPCDERHGLVFVVATPGAKLDVDAHLGAFGDVLAAMDLSKCARVKSGELPVAANWKYALDTYGEGYHFATLHPQTISPNTRNDVVIYDQFDPHHRVGFAERALESMLDAPESDWDIRNEPSGIHYLFPNTILFAGSITPGKMYLTTFRHFPGETPGETITHKTVYAYGGVRSPEHRAEVEAAYDGVAHVVRTEDYVVAAEGWRNLTLLDPDDTVVYGRQEIALQNTHRAIARAIGVPSP